MKENINQWVRQQAAVQGVLACGVRHSDDTLFFSALPANYTREGMENVFRCLAHTFQVLKLNQLPHQQVRWVYEQALLYGASRADGGCLGVFTSKEPGTVNLEWLGKMLTEFPMLGL